MCKCTSTANSFPESLPECSVCAHRARRCWQARKPGALSWFSARRFTLLRTVRGNRQRKIHQTMRRLAVHDPSLTGALGGRHRCVLEQLNDAKCIRKILRHMFRRLPLRVKCARASQAGVCSHSLKSDYKVKSLLECRNHNQLCLRQNTCIKIFIKIPRHHYKYWLWCQYDIRLR